MYPTVSGSNRRHDGISGQSSAAVVVLPQPKAPFSQTITWSGYETTHSRSAGGVAVRDGQLCGQTFRPPWAHGQERKAPLLVLTCGALAERSFLGASEGRRKMILRRNRRSEGYVQIVIFSITCSFLGAPGRIRTCAHRSGGHIRVPR